MKVSGIVFFAPAILALLVSCGGGPKSVDSIRSEDFRSHIEYLSSPELEGRNNGTPGGKKAAEYVVSEMKRIGLEPGGKDGWYHHFETKRARGGDVPAFGGSNVIGLLRGTALPDEYIVINAHHDHLGVVKGKIRPGADDNASGVAMILELAEAFVENPPRRSLLFVSFDAEEDGLVGSRKFVASGIYDPKSIVADICFDLIGGDFYPTEGNRIYALGSESSPELAVILQEADKGGLDVAQGGIYIIEPFGFSRSDYRAFRDRKIPFVFFSCGTPWYYHSSHDTIDKINWPKIQKAGRFAWHVVKAVADREKRLTFDPALLPTRTEAELLKSSIEAASGHEEIILDDRLRKQGAAHVEKLGRLLDKETLEKRDRLVIQQAMIWLFRVQASQIRWKGK